MHFCKFNLEFVGIGYKPSSDSNYSFETFELYRCKKCKSLVFKNKSKHNHLFLSMYEEDLLNAKRCGYVALGELIKENPKKEDKGCALSFGK